MRFRNDTEKKTFIFFLIVPLSVGLLSYLLTRNGISNYMSLQKPSFAPPRFIFFLVWPILYALMGVSSYKIYDSINYHKSCCLLIYALNLILNFFWSLIFFNLEARLFAFIFILFLDLVVFYMIICFLGVDKKAGLYQIPYFVWLIFATILNFSVYFLNR